MLRCTKLIDSAELIGPSASTSNEPPPGNHTTTERSEAPSMTANKSLPNDDVAYATKWKSLVVSDNQVRRFQF